MTSFAVTRGPMVGGAPDGGPVIWSGDSAWTDEGSLIISRDPEPHESANWVMVAAYAPGEWRTCVEVPE